MKINQSVTTERHRSRTPNKTLLSAVAVALGLLIADQAQAAGNHVSVITVLPGDPHWFAFTPDASSVQITSNNPRSGTGSLELSKGFGGGSAFINPQDLQGFGRFGDLNVLSLDWFIDPSSSHLLPPDLALAVYPFGDPRQFFLHWDTCSPAVGCGPYPAGSWQSTDLIGNLSIQPAGGNPPPASLADIPPDAPITEIHIRTSYSFGEPWHGFVDNVTIGFRHAGAIAYNFEVTPLLATKKISSCPVVITSPGTYAVTQDLACSGTAITVTASKVSLSLGGHTISGSGTGDGILVQGAANVSIANGTVQGFENGVDFQGALDCKVSNLTLMHNSNVGIEVNGGTIGLTVTGNTASQNGVYGIQLNGGSAGTTVTHNTANQNGQIGIVGGFTVGNTVTANTANQNAGWGIWVGNAFVDNTLADNTTVGNAYGGINLTNAKGNTVTHNTSDLNGGVGIDIDGTSSGNIVARNSATANTGWGISLTSNPDGSPAQNTVQDNTITGSPNGILLRAGTQNTVAGNAVTLSVVGIEIEQGSTGNTIQGNTALTNRDADLEDGNAGCDSNIWTNNKFATDNVAGASDGGPGAGCIR